MKSTQIALEKDSLIEPKLETSFFEQQPSHVNKLMLKKLKGGSLLVMGYLLSPLCWWNDLIFNLPLAYCFGYACSWISPNLLLPGAIAGYWISNIAGILLMQAGAVDVFQGKDQARNVKKELLNGLVSSTVYTLVILALIQCKILDTPPLFLGQMGG